MMNELKLEMVALKATVQVLETEKQQFVEKEKQYEKENADLKRKLTVQEDGCDCKAKHKKLGTIIQTSQQEIGEMAEPEQSHEMKVELPLENWYDLLALVPRSQLGIVVAEIGDYHFTQIIQSFLHDEVRKITLGEMHIIPPRSGVSSDQQMVKVWPNEATNMPDCPMPRNVKNFMAIHSNYVDVSVLNFLQKFQENSLLSNVNLDFGLPHYIITNEIMRELTQIVLLVNSIDSINFPVGDFLEMAYSNKKDKLLKKLMEMTRILAIELDDWGSLQPRAFLRNKIVWCFSWLYTPRDDGRPRMLISNSTIDTSDFISLLIERFKKDFEKANRSVSFFVRIRIKDNANVQSDYISFDNAKTNEKLVIKTKIAGKWKKLMISRYPLNAAENWIEANENEISEWNTSELNRKIYLASDELNR